MNKVVFVIVRVLCAISLLACIGWWFENYVYADIAYADELDMGVVSDKLYDPDAEEYGAICAMLGGEPELSDVTVQEYLMVCRAWKGHYVVAAERGSEYRWVEDYSYKSGFFSTTTMSHVQTVKYIVAVDNHGNEFRYYL